MARGHSGFVIQGYLQKCRDAQMHKAATANSNESNIQCAIIVIVIWRAKKICLARSITTDVRSGTENSSTF